MKRPKKYKSQIKKLREATSAELNRMMPVKEYAFRVQLSVPRVYQLVWEKKITAVKRFNKMFILN